MIVWPAKDPGATEKFAFDFTEALGTDTIVSQITTPTGVDMVSDAINGALVEVELSGGTVGTVAIITCTIVTSGGETIPAFAVLPIGGDLIDLDTAKAAQKIEVTDEDALLGVFLRSSIRHIESATSKNATQQVESQAVAGFPPCDRGIRFWKGPVQSVLDVKYDDPDGVEQTLTSYRLIEGKDAQLLPAYGESWPKTAYGPGTVRISYIAGYDPTDRDLAIFIQAVLMLFGHFHMNREAVNSDTRAAAVELPLGVQMLIDDIRTPGLA